ncbi:WXG100 family type VII secretion target [Paenibacillus glucanolyticus]
MTKILVPPEVLLAVSDQFDRASDQLETNKNTLNQQIQMLVSCWDGTTCSRFYYDFQQAYRDMKLTIEHMQVTSQELKRIAYRFMQVDNEADHTDPRCLAPQLVFPDGMSEVHSGKGMEEKSFGDQLKDLGDEAKAFAEGAKSGATALWSSVKDTTSSLIEDPIGTGKQMAYDATVGTAEEIVNTTVWGAKMAFDVGDTREKFDERIQTEQERMNEMGMSTYLGQQGALILGGVALNRVGVKKTPNLRHDAGGDGSKEQGNAGKNHSKNIDLSKIGTGNIGDFQGVTDVNDLISRIPPDAKQIPWREVPGGAKEGVKFRWLDESGKTWDIRAHSVDLSAPSGSNAANGWIYRVEVKQVDPKWKWTMDSNGNFHKENVLRANSPHYDESIANDTHIPFTP